MTASDSGTLLSTLQYFHSRPTAPTEDELSPILDGVMNVLNHENPDIRTRSRSDYSGGLLHLPLRRTTIIVPDLHARTGYLMALMNRPLYEMSVIDALLAGQAQIICVGDGFHSEARGFERWRRALKEYNGQYEHHMAMDEEMKESLSLMAMVMLLKTACPDGFHFLKGNHENVTSSNSNGNRAFYKFVCEGAMVKDWFLKFLGRNILDRWAQFESALPLVAVGEYCMISHAEPRIPYSPDEIIEYRGNDQLIFDFTWTGNDEAEPGSVATMLDLHLGENAAEAFYFGGHRPISGMYGLRANGRFIQFHNPERYIAVVLENGRTPSPTRDIIEIKEGDHGTTR